MSSHDCCSSSLVFSQQDPLSIRVSRIKIDLENTKMQLKSEVERMKSKENEQSTKDQME